ncbi:hypothetical protein KVR01_006425 [Diaporthe batatas]|uniref:uncharacterized protein n=1 Tax=Diaporthe batatas TaxID=748121 RepID=UPI001D05A958|nr:uncharacterized protein KVR01_006425 [Diaporthe batatas]KAG8164507.1 hypothetical protein KVR01_006425 [Diaporthe batatas]
MASPPPPPAVAPGKIRLATSSPSTQATTAATLAQLRQIATRAARDHAADMLLLPEAYLGGYPRGTSFGCVVGSRSAGGRDEFVRYFEGAVDLGDTAGEGAGAGEDWVARRLGAVNDGEGGGPARGDGTREELEAIAAETGVFLVTGLIEKAGGSLYCSVVYVCPRKGVIGKRRKVMPTACERLIWAQGSPRTLKAVSTVIRGVRVNMAAAICWENYMPLLRQSLYAQNVNLYLAPTADGRDAWAPLMRTIGIEGRCFVLSSNMCVREAPAAPAGGSAIAIAADGAPYGRERRSSCVTEEGFEIALPAHGAPGGAGKGPKARRPSVFDEDGNEIVLCGAEGGGESESAPAATNGARGGAEAVRKTAGGGKFVSRGGSCITDPFGEVLAGPQWEDDTGIIYADVDLKDCIRGRLDLDAGGSYSRNDSFRFSVEGLSLEPLPY